MTSTTRLTKKLERKLKKGDRKYPRGCSGIYVQLSNTKGIKILESRFPNTYCDGFRMVLRDALKEASFLKEAGRRVNIVPKCFGVKILRLQGAYAIGIVMQHVGSMPLANLRYMDDSPISKIYKEKQYEHWPEEQVKRTLRNAGINHSDIHGKNIMYHRGRYWAIDFDSSFVHFSERNHVIV